MNTKTLRIPQLGEGLHEVNVIRLLKKVGEPVRRDEPIYQVETDKALVDVESSCSGTLSKWYCEEGATIEIDAPVADILTEVGSGRHANAFTPPSQVDPYSLKTQPTWRGEPVMSRLMDHEQRPYPANGASRKAAVSRPAAAEDGVESYTLSPRQQSLVRRMSRQTEAIPASIHSTIDWMAFKDSAEKLEARLGIGAITDFEYLALAVSRSVRKHSAFRSRLTGVNVEVFPYLNLGLAVALRNGELAIAVLREADRLPPIEFFNALRDSVRLARRGTDQVDPVMQLQLSHLGTLGVHSAAPVLVPPSVGTLFLGSPITSGNQTSATLSLTFDHRLVNGVGAATYLRHVAKLLCGNLPIA